MVIKKVLILAGILLLASCSSGYEEKNGKITFNGREITDKNFVVLNEVFAKDSAYAYYKEKSIAGADIGTFEAVDKAYAKDKNRVYYCDEFRDGKNYYLTKYQVVKVVEKAIPASFKIIEAGYAKDSVHGFYGGRAFKVKDITTLKGINSNFAKDNIQAYFNCKPLSGSDGKTFGVLSECYAKDTGHIYYYRASGEAKESVFVLPCHRASFQILAYPFSKDSTVVFYENLQLPGADAASFGVLNHGYSKDKNVVYIQAKKITGADPVSFEVIADNEDLTQDDYFAKDKNKIYWFDKQVTGINFTAFKALGHGYATDGTNVFYKTVVIQHADPKTFKVYPHDFGNADAEDVHMKYHSGKKAGEDE